MSEENVGKDLSKKIGLTVYQGVHTEESSHEYRECSKSFKQKKYPYCTPWSPHMRKAL
jgi:hypothetical protein